MTPNYQVGIIGAGFGGLIAALRLKESGRNSFVVFERADEVGGTWRENTYPGCACDVQSDVYSISSEPNPNWSETYSPQAEIWDYLKNVTDKRELRKHIHFNFSVQKAEFISEFGYWKVTNQNGEAVTVKVLIGAIGPLNRPIIPSFNGLENFKGEQFHSSRWNHNYDLQGKRVAVVGTGASAIQIVPAIAPIVKDLVVFQRTAAWIAPRHNRKNTAFKKKLYTTFPFLQSLSRKMHYHFNEFVGLGFIGNKTIHAIATRVSLRNYKAVKDSEIRKKLTPTYALGCKRVLKTDDYLPTFNRENVHLETSGIDRFTENSIITKEGVEYKVDAVIFGTGFEVTDFKTGTQLVGSNGRDIFEYWRENGVAAYHGITVAHYPNFGLLLGPNTGLGHNSVVDIMESQMVYLMQYIAAIEKLPANVALDVKQTVQNNYNEKLQKQFDGTVWSSGCKSWYLDRNGKNVTLYPRLNTTYRNAVKHFHQEDFRQMV